MKLIVLCGGRGSRLGKLTEDKPKALVDIGGETILDVALLPHSNYYYVFSAGYKGLDLSRYVCTRYPGSECFFEDMALGTALAVKEIASFFEDDYFGVINGDTYFAVDLKKSMLHMKEFKDKKACVFIATNAIDEKPACAGAYIFRKDFLDYIPDEPSLLAGAIEKCNKDGAVMYYQTNRLFYDLGTEDGINIYKYDYSSQNSS